MNANGDVLGQLVEGAVEKENARDLVAVDYCVAILTHFQYLLFVAIIEVYKLDAEMRNRKKNELGIKQERIDEMKEQCDGMLNKKIPLSQSLKFLEAIWQTLESDKMIAKKAKSIAELQQKFDGNVPGGASLYKRLQNNPQNVSMLEEYQEQ